ncbi:MAG: hypothetical protein IJI43_04145 [Bacilli bacterium]|nr:hypothetical protein [Bacilli bacterium]
MEFICLFFPTLIAMGKDINTKNIYKVIYDYAMYNLSINFISFLIVRVVTQSQLVIDSNLWTMKFTLKYIILSSFIALILPKVIEFLKKNFSISIKRSK